MKIGTRKPVVFLKPKCLNLCGMDRPVHIRKISYEHPDFATIEMHVGDWGGGEFATVGCEGIQLYRSEAAAVDGHSFEQCDPVPEGPLTEWMPVEVWSDQTGGMTMIDVVRFANGQMIYVCEEGMGWCELTDDEEEYCTPDMLTHYKYSQTGGVNFDQCVFDTADDNAAPSNPNDALRMGPRD